MKTFLYSLLLSVILMAPAWADSNTDGSANDEQDFKIQIDLENHDSVDNEMSEADLERKIKSKVLTLIANAIDASNDGLSEDEKNEIKNEIKDAIEEIEEITDDETGRSIRIGSDEPFFAEAALGAMAIFFIFGTPIMIIAAALYAGYRKKRLMHETINQYVSSGKDIPEEVLQGLQKEATPRSNLHKGLVMSGIGLGIFACFAVIGSLSAAAFGLIPLFIGLAQLLIWKLENK